MIEPDSIRALEMAAVLSELEPLAATPLGAERVRSARPLASLAAATREAEKIAEYRRIREAGRDQALRAAEVRPVLAALGKDGLLLTPQDLTQVRRLLDGFREAVRLLGTVDDVPVLKGLVRQLPALPSLAQGLERTVDDEGNVLDSASPELASLRNRRRTLQERLDRAVERFFSAKDLGERIVTVRDDRTVVAIRADLGASRFGLVHGRSSSGATLYVEPFELVEPNNAGIELRDEERAEVQRLLRHWTERLAAARDELEGAAELVGELDFARARARLAEALEAAPVEPAADGSIRLEGARHALLVLDRRRQGKPAASVVPLDLALAAGETLVITGPNTGGKTVALKTVGLSVLLFACGLPVAARKARLPFIKALFVDIGDPQDIAQNLSTFSGHLKRIGRPLAGFPTPALVLLDELGAGTDPREGSMLAVAVVERLRRLGATSIVTSHHEPLKHYALSTPGVRSAAVEFDEATLAPTFRLLVDRTGSSNALIIAERLGVPAEVIEHARALLASTSGDADRLLERVERMQREQEGERRRLEERERAHAEQVERLAAREQALGARDDELRRREQGVRARLRAEFEARVKGALDELRDEGRARIAALAPEGRRREDKLTSALLGTASRILREAETGPAAAGETGAGDGTAESPAVLAPGARVRVRRFGVNGTLLELDGERAVVEVSGKRLAVAASDLDPAAAPDPSQPAPAPARPDPGTAREGKAGLHPELNLIGRRVEEALAQVDKFLDDAVLAQLAEVRIIHGHGSGRLRAGLRQHLQAHPQVRSIESESKGGATRAVLKD